MYADIDFWLALLTQGDDGATDAVADEESLEVSLVTFVQLFLLAETYELDLEQAITAILTLAEFDGDADVLYRAAAYHEDGLDAFQAFHAALGDTRVVSGDEAYDDVGIQRLWVE